MICRIEAQHIKAGDGLLFWQNRTAIITKEFKTVITKEFKTVKSVDEVNDAVIVSVKGFDRQFSLERGKLYTIEREEL